MASKKKKTFGWEDNYVECDELGEGGNGSVFCVYEKSTGQEYALKTLSNKKNEKKARFVNEIQIVKQYAEKIDGILPIYEYSKDEFWYMMPVAEPVMKYISDNRLSIDKVVCAVIQLADTLAQLHDQDISHRDIKPSNIYYYNGKYCLADFGLAEFLESGDEFTRSDQGLGAIFTIAPEMKRDPKHADGKKADVFSLAKTTWMLLSGEERGFDGVYQFLDKSYSLRFMPQYQGVHLVELEALLSAATQNDPLLRPTMREYRQGLEEWLEIFADEGKSQESDWSFLKRYLFGENAPESACWSNLARIVYSLNLIASVPAYNHMLLPAGGGTDLVSVEMAPEDGCIYLHDNLGGIIVVKPKRLYFTSFENDISWNYFFLELSEMAPIFSKSEFLSEHLVEDEPGHYVSAKYAQYGVYDYDTGDLLPVGYKVVERYYKGNILIVFKQGPYNGIPATYDGRQSMVDYQTFSKHMEDLVNTYNSLVKKGYEPESILNASMFGRNPYLPKKEENVTDLIKSIQETKKYIEESYLNWDFSGLLNCTEQQGSAVFYIEFVLEKNNVFDFLPTKRYVLCTDGRIKPIDPKELYQCAYIISSRDEIYKLVNACDEYVREQCGVGKDDFLICGAHFSVGMRKNGIPKHLFTREEIGEAMRQADDRVSNVLVIDEDGYAHVISNIYHANSYPVRHELWDAGNCYVGKYSDLSTLNDMYVQSLEGWYDYLTHGRRVRKDYIEGSLSCEELIKKIHVIIDS